jgi:hypothetical protein
MKAPEPERPPPDLKEGPESFERFKALAKGILAVPKAEIESEGKKAARKKARAKAKKKALR